MICRNDKKKCYYVLLANKMSNIFHGEFFQARVVIMKI